MFGNVGRTAGPAYTLGRAVAVCETAIHRNLLINHDSVSREHERSTRA
jgi:hypothetical protein